MKLTASNNLIVEVKNILKQARHQTVQQINHLMVTTYFEIGKKIVEDEQQGNGRADYGKKVLLELSVALQSEFGKGFSVTNLKQMRTFYITYHQKRNFSISKKGQTVSDEFKLSWSHYLKLMRIKNNDERDFYENEAYSNNWSIREFKRQFDSALFERLTLSRDKKEIKRLSKGQLVNEPKDIIKEPYILEFLGLKEENKYSENKFELAIISKIDLPLCLDKKEYLLRKDIFILIWCFSTEYLKHLY